LHSFRPLLLLPLLLLAERLFAPPQGPRGPHRAATQLASVIQFCALGAGGVSAMCQTTRRFLWNALQFEVQLLESIENVSLTRLVCTGLPSIDAGITALCIIRNIAA
jgi:hypothetical protein